MPCSSACRGLLNPPGDNARQRWSWIPNASNARLILCPPILSARKSLKKSITANGILVSFKALFSASFLWSTKSTAPASYAQAALLQAMQKHNVTVVGANTPPHALSRTGDANPIEQEGIYPLPEAQLDRFLLQIDVDYPDLEAERQIVQNTSMPFDGAIRNVIYAERIKGPPAIGVKCLWTRSFEGILAPCATGDPKQAPSTSLKNTSHGVRGLVPVRPSVWRRARALLSTATLRRR